MLFPETGASYDSKDNSLKKFMEDFYAQSISINQSYWSQAEIDSRFEAGDQALFGELYGNLPMNNRRQFNFNRIRRITNMISGYQRRNRMSTIVTPIENGDEQTADQFSKVMLWAMHQENMLETISEAFHGAIVTGMSLLQLWVDYRSDPVSGNIKLDNCAYNSFLIDPFFKKKDLSDCNGLWKRSYLTKRECISLLPDYANEIEDMTGNTFTDGKFQFMPETYAHDKKNLLSYDEFYYRDYRKQRMLIDSQTGETMEWKASEEERLKEFLNFYPQVTVIDQEIPSVRMAILVQGHVMYDGPNPMGIDSYPFVPVLGYYSPQLSDFSNRIQGVVRGLRDAQYLYTRRMVIELDILESQVTSGFKYKEDSLVDPKSVFMAGQGRGIALKQGAQMTDVEQIIAPQIPPSMAELSKTLADEIQQISGVNDELLGSAIDDKAGILSMLRQGAGLTILQTLFDQLDYSQKLVGRRMMEIMQTNFTPGKIKRIIEEEPAPQFYNKAFGRYDAVVEEGLNTSTQRQMQFAQLLQLKEVGVQIPDDVLLESSTLQDKKKLTEAVAKAQQQQQQMEQQQQQVTMQEMQTRSKLSEARVTEQMALAKERDTRALANLGLMEERRMEAVKDLEQASLNKIKAISELEDMDLGQIEKLLIIARMFNEGEQAQASIQDVKTVSTARSTGAKV